MNTNSEFDDRSHSQPTSGLSNRNARHTNDFTGAMDMVKRDRFELLSAYLDGEVTAAERRQVEDWLAHDQSVKQLHQRLLKLRSGLRTMPIPQSQQPVAETVDKVLGRLHHRSRLLHMFGGAAIAACAFGVVSGLFSGDSRTMRFAKQPIEQTQPNAAKPASAIMVAVSINEPLFQIPKTAKISPENSSKRQQQPTTRSEKSLY
jgi:anti-sigma factor RsiW